MKLQTIEYQGKRYQHDEITLRLYEEGGAEVVDSLTKIHITTYATEIEAGEYFDIPGVKVK